MEKYRAFKDLSSKEKNARNALKRGPSVPPGYAFKSTKDYDRSQNQKIIEEGRKEHEEDGENHES